MKSSLFLRFVFALVLSLFAMAAWSQAPSSSASSRVAAAPRGHEFPACCTNCPPSGCTGCNAYSGSGNLNCGSGLLKADCTMTNNQVSCTKDESTSSAVRPGAATQLAAPPRQSRASIDLVCGGKTFTLSTGNDKGSCSVNESGTGAACADGYGGGAKASCDKGCVSSSGAGSCSTK
jgi:hypothetical protein